MLNVYWVAWVGPFKANGEGEARAGRRRAPAAPGEARRGGGRRRARASPRLVIRGSKILGVFLCLLIGCQLLFQVIP
jgi:hypothetical protein